MEIRELRAFVAVAEEGGMSAAARRLHVSQSALSQTIQSLERQAGAQLLARDHAGARPTRAGPGPPGGSGLRRRAGRHRGHGRHPRRGALGRDRRARRRAAAQARGPGLDRVPALRFARLA
ncbi:MAG TPA: LysR family transcriptional regulator [Streptosporangiaceae bacterium]|nr:LysR family transcriptional regulator [Streptosporangiaceae bacterium]